MFFPESRSKSSRGTEKTCHDTQSIPGIGEQESSSAGNIHHHELQNELKNFNREIASERELLILAFTGVIWLHNFRAS